MQSVLKSFFTQVVLEWVDLIKKKTIKGGLNLPYYKQIKNK